MMRHVRLFCHLHICDSHHIPREVN